MELTQAFAARYDAKKILGDFSHLESIAAFRQEPVYERNFDRYNARYWPCNSNSVCLGSCRLPSPGARSTDFGLSAGILATGPAPNILRLSD